MAISTNLGDNLFPFLGAEKGYTEWLKVENRHHRNELFQKLREQSFMVVSGKAGIGKSYFIYNELIPELKKGFSKNGFDEWIVIDLSLNRYPLTELANQLAELSHSIIDVDQERKDPNIVLKYYEQMQQSPMALIDIVEKLLEQSGRLLNILIYADGLDFYLKKKPVKDDLAESEFIRFNEQIARAVSQQAYPIHFIGSIRDSYVSKYLAVESVQHLISRNTHQFRPYTQDDLESYLNRFTDNFMIEVSEALKTELFNAYASQDLSIGEWMHALHLTYSKFIDDPNSGASLELSEYKSTGGADRVLSQQCTKGFNKLKANQKDLLKRILSLIVQKDEYGKEESVVFSISNLATLLEVEASEIFECINSFNQNAGFVFKYAEPALVESKLHKLSSEEQDEANSSSDLCFVSDCYLWRFLKIRSWVESFYQDRATLLEIANDERKRESLYRDQKLANILAWKNKLWFTDTLGRYITPDFKAALSFIDQSQEEEENRIRRQKADEQSRKAKEKRFKLTLIISASLAVLIISLVVVSTIQLNKQQNEITRVEEDLKAKQDSLLALEKLRAQSVDSIRTIQNQIESKILENQFFADSLEIAKNNMRAQQDRLVLIQASLLEDSMKLVRLTKQQEDLLNSVRDAEDQANRARLEASFTSAINRINSMVFNADQLLRNRNPLDFTSLEDAGSIALMAYDSLSTLETSPYALLVEPSRFDEPTKSLYTLMTGVYSQIRASEKMENLPSISQSRAIGQSAPLFIGTNSGELYRIKSNLINQITDSLQVEEQVLDMSNAQIRFIHPTGDERFLLIRLSDHRIVLYDFLYGQILNVLKDGEDANQFTAANIFSVEDNRFLTLQSGKLTQFEISESLKINVISTKSSAPEADPWIRLDYDPVYQNAYVRTAKNTLSIYNRSALDGSFKLVDERYLVGLDADISQIMALPNQQSIILGLQNGSLVTVPLDDEGKKIRRSDGMKTPIFRHEGAILDMRLSPSGQLLATSGIDGKVLLWNVPMLIQGTFNRSLLFREIDDLQAIHQVYFPNENQLVSVSSGFRYDDADYKGLVVNWPLKLPEMAKLLRNLYRDLELQVDMEKINQEMR